MDRLEAGGIDLHVPAPRSPDSSFWDSNKTLIDVGAFKRMQRLFKFTEVDGGGASSDTVQLP